MIVDTGIKVFKQQIVKIEKIINQHGILLIDRTPMSVTIDNNISMILDEFIFREILNGSQNFLDIHVRVFRKFLTPSYGVFFIPTFIIIKEEIFL
ncbi:hypothetical protein BBF96_02790 [Anoxybacter fermentans]|uniref:Uncharacterized protein n=1 Tax=Anoxybacter fermentans TaxID=1323375 RepID=A0A3S9SVR7_9FIRM|nr:hypothetical protein BBF96_02790 [Anoxybacter fermentans]